MKKNQSLSQRHVAERKVDSSDHNAASRNPNAASGNKAAAIAAKSSDRVENDAEFGPDNEQGTTQNLGKRPGQWATADQQRVPSPNFITPHKPTRRTKPGR
jgi:hypothetical protein